MALGLVLWLVWPSGAPDPSNRQAETPTQAADASDDDFVMVQTETGADPGVRRDPRAAFLHLRRDPMILRLEAADPAATRTMPGPDTGLALGRAGPPAPDRISVLREALFQGERRLVTTLPSSRDDFALFQARRSEALAEAVPPDRPSAPVEAGAVVRVDEDSSWGTLISGDAGSTVEAAVYVETRIENTTSQALALRENQRFALYDDSIVVLQADRTLTEVLGTNGLTAEQAAQAAQAARRLLTLPEPLARGSVVALRMRNDSDGRSLMQMSLYAPEGYLASIAQVGVGRFEPSADPWLRDNLLGRSDRLRRTELAVPQQVRLLDAIYSAAIRNGLPTNLVGELIVILSQRFDLDRFVADGDALTLVQATRPGPEGQGVGQILYVGVAGPSGELRCYVLEGRTTSGFGCYDFDATETVGGGSGGSLGSGLVVPVNGVRTSGFGPRHHPILKQVRLHQGVDWAAPTGTPIHAAAAGLIAVAGDGGGYGNVVYIDHPGGMQTRYAHLHTFADGIRKGVRVEAGQVIGTVGTTGRSTGPHLHFEVIVNGTPVDPLGGGASGGGSQAVEALVDQIIRVESGGDARAKNALSTATGLGQFIESTWLRMMRDYRPDLARTMDRAQLLELRFDPALSREMVRNLARENESFLRGRGHQITAGRLYLAHFLGPSGAATALGAKPEVSVQDVMGAAVVNANPFLRGKTIADLTDWADRKMAGARGGGGGGSGPTVTRRVAVPAAVATYRETIDALLKAL